MSAQEYTPIECGPLHTEDYRVYFRDSNGKIISPFHDIPLYADNEKKTVNMLVEIPRWSNAKMEIGTKDLLNPIKQDVKKGQMRFVRNVFPHRGYIWNYGALPQTWEDPNHVDPGTKAKGDNDPIDVIEIGQRVACRGDVLQVKLLGTMALIDEGETDWKIIAIDVRDPLASQMNDVADVERLCPGLLAATEEWFRVYKVPDGKPENVFAFEGKAKDAAFAYKVVEETHGFWKRLIAGEVDAGGLELTNTTVDSKFKITAEQSAEVVEKKPKFAEAPEWDSANDKWYYVSNLLNATKK